MSKSSLTLSSWNEQELENPSSEHDSQQSQVLETDDDDTSNADSHGEEVDAHDSSLGVSREASSLPKLHSASTPRPRKPVLGTRGGLPAAFSSNMLDALPQRLHPYHSSPVASVASASHGNLLETSSITSGSAVESSGTSDRAESEADAGFKSSSLPRSEADHTFRTSRKPNKQVFQQIMSRSRSIRQDNGDGRNLSRLNVARGRFFDSSRSRERSRDLQTPRSPRTAPLEPDRSYREAMHSSSSNRLGERSNTRNRSADGMVNAADDGNEFMKPVTSRFATAMVAGRGFFGRLARRESSNERETPTIEEAYQVRIINLPLIEQSRATRIRRILSEAKDKTEFWLPALPYRCIDFLNLKGTEEEGLYRVPGSVREIRYWQERFDRELDVNLLDVEDLDDVNTVGSLLKAWFRDQPDDLIPAAVQKRISAECADIAPMTDDVPQFFKDELSYLPPCNYYLLFAITAHLALLRKHSEKNKMDYRNLSICFKPCLNIDATCFNFLVTEWRHCWQGCYTEKAYLDEEYRAIAQSLIPPNPGAASAAAVSGGLQSQNTNTAVYVSGGSQSQAPGVSNTKTRDDPILAQPGFQSQPGNVPSTPPQRPHRPNALQAHKEAEKSLAESRKPPPAPQSSPRRPHTPTTPTIGPVTNISPLRM